MIEIQHFPSLRHRHPAPKASGGWPLEVFGVRVISRSGEAAQGDRCPMWYVYFLELINGDIYVGSTNDLKRRFSSHQAGRVLSTKAYLPAALKSYIAVEAEDHARELEAYFKSGSGKAVAMKRLIRSAVRP
jgi:predicted GIY-YIG superfamily endonuclease